MKDQLFIASELGEAKAGDDRIWRGVVGSSGVLDRHGDTVNPNGWNLENFKKNPVILYGHDHRGLPIGKAINVEVKDGKLMFDIQFSKKSQLATEVWNLIKEGILKAVSVGFMVEEWGMAGDPYTIMKQELFELSVVTIPANPEALGKMATKSMTVDTLEQKVARIAELLEKGDEDVEEPESGDDPESTEDPEEPEAVEEDDVEEQETDDEKAFSITFGKLKEVLDVCDKNTRAKVVNALVEVVKAAEDETDEKEQKMIEALKEIRKVAVKADSHIAETLKLIKNELNLKGGENK